MSASVVSPGFDEGRDFNLRLERGSVTHSDLASWNAFEINMEASWALLRLTEPRSAIQTA